MFLRIRKLKYKIIKEIKYDKNRKHDFRTFGINKR